MPVLAPPLTDPSGDPDLEGAAVIGGAGDHRSNPRNHHRDAAGQRE